MGNYAKLETSNARKAWTKTFHSRASLKFSLSSTRRLSLGCVFWHKFPRFLICLRHLPAKSSCSPLLLIDNPFVHLPRVVVSLLYGHHNVVMMRQVPAQTDVLRVLVRAQVAGESSLTAALEAHVSCQVVLQRVPLPAGGTLESLIFAVAGIPRARSNCGDLRGRGGGVSLSAVDRGIFWGMEALVKTWKKNNVRALIST